MSKKLVVIHAPYMDYKVALNTFECMSNQLKGFESYQFIVLPKTIQSTNPYDWEVHEVRPCLSKSPPNPYVMPKRYVVKSMQELDPGSHPVSGFCVWSTRGGVGAYNIPTREAAERIAAIYEEVMP